MTEQSRYALDDDARMRITLLLNMLTKETRACKACGRDIWMVPLASTGKPHPFTNDAVSHFADCPKAGEFRRK